MTAEITNHRRRAGGIILFACVIIAIALFVLTHMEIIAASLFMLLLAAIIMGRIISLGIAFIAIPMYIMKNTTVEPGSYELDEVTAVSKGDKH